MVIRVGKRDILSIQPIVFNPDLLSLATRKRQKEDQVHSQANTWGYSRSRVQEAPTFCATPTRRNGASDFDLQADLGHATPATTAKYTHHVGCVGTSHALHSAQSPPDHRRFIADNALKDT
ncbi:hypothetical protein [Nostoc sp. LEGE 12450]|uniref:hypothetical protein n=1 Tax=Nostoc sp. LEGE 12450 TaxID=1828643 RepID=UPI001D13EB9E|nr:hypothetical protein [Nostoc sp. LEGE 12450]